MRRPRPARPYCCHTATAPARELALPPEADEPVCVVRLLGRCPARLVVIEEHPDNRGDPATARLDAVVDGIRRQLLGCRHEPVWVEYAPSRALLAVVSGAGPAEARHELVRGPDGWYRRELPRPAYQRLLLASRALSRCARRTGAARDACQDRGPQPW